MRNGLAVLSELGKVYSCLLMTACSNEALSALGQKSAVTPPRRCMSHMGRKRSVGRRDPADHSGRQPALNRCYFNLFNRQEPSQFFRVYPNQIPPSAAIDVDAIQLQD